MKKLRGILKTARKVKRSEPEAPRKVTDASQAGQAPESGSWRAELATARNAESTNYAMSPGDHAWNLAVNAVLPTVTAASGMIPPLQSALRSIAPLVSQFDTFRGNNARVNRLAETLQQLDNILSHHIQNNDPDRQQRLEMIARAFVEATNVVTAQKQRNPILGVLQGESDAARLNNCLAAIFRHIELLQLDTSLRSQNLAERTRYHSLLQTLGRVANVSYNIATIHDNNVNCAGCLPGTRVQILSDLLRWGGSEDSDFPLLWLGGMAGTGKTTIAQTFCEQLDSQGLLGASFFCSRPAGLGQNDVRRIIPTVVFYLAYRIPKFITELCRVLETPDVASLPIPEQLTQLLLAPLKNAVQSQGASSISARGPVVIVVDALDECADTSAVEQLLHTLNRHSKDLQALGIRICLTSRSEHRIRVVIDIVQSPYKIIQLHNIPESVVQEDIHTFVKAELTDITNRREWRSWYSQADVDLIVSEANGLFIYAATVLRYLRGSKTTPTKRLDIIRHVDSSGRSMMTRPLDQLYATILENLGSADDTEEFEINDIRRILFTLACAFSPLRVIDVADLLELDIIDVRHCLRSLSSVVFVPAISEEDLQSIQMLHASFSDFLLSSDPITAPWTLNVPLYHSQYTVRCLEIMSERLHEGILGPSATRRIAVVDVPAEKILRNISPVLRYACHHWLQHFLEASGKDYTEDEKLQLHEQAQAVLNGRLLQWVECLAWSGGIQSTIRILQGCKNQEVFQQLGSPSKAVLHDILRLLKESYDCISVYPLEIYHSALIWLPTEICPPLAQERNRRRLPTVLHGLRDSWSLCESVISTIEADSVILSLKALAIQSDVDPRVCISPDDESVAHWWTGHNVVRIYSMHTGALDVEIVVENAGIDSVCFLDIHHVLLGTTDGKVRIHDLRTKSEIYTLSAFPPQRRVTVYVFWEVSMFVACSEGDALVWQIPRDYSILEPVDRLSRAFSDGEILSVCIASSNLITISYALLQNGGLRVVDCTTSRTSEPSTDRAIHLDVPSLWPKSNFFFSAAFSKDGKKLVFSANEEKRFLRKVPPMQGSAYYFDDFRISNQPVILLSGARVLSSICFISPSTLVGISVLSWSTPKSLTGDGQAEMVFVGDFSGAHTTGTIVAAIPHPDVSSMRTNKMALVQCSSTNSVISIDSRGTIRVWKVPDMPTSSKERTMGLRNRLEYQGPLFVSQKEPRAHWISGPRDLAVITCDVSSPSPRFHTSKLSPVAQILSRHGLSVRMVDDAIISFTNNSLLYSPLVGEPIDIPIPEGSILLDDFRPPMVVTSSDGRWIAVAAYLEHEVYLVDVQSRNYSWFPNPNRQKYYSTYIEMAFSLDGNTLVIVYCDSQRVYAQVVDTHSGDVRFDTDFVQQSRVLNKILLSDDANWLLVQFLPDPSVEIRHFMVDLNTGEKRDLVDPGNHIRHEFDLLWAKIPGWEPSDPRLGVPAQAQDSIQRISPHLHTEHMCWIPTDYRLFEWHGYGQFGGSHIFLSTHLHGIVVVEFPVDGS